MRKGGRKIKIALISGSLLPTPPPHYGGLEQVVFDLACGLTELGHKVVVFATKGSKVPPKGFLCEVMEPTMKVHVNWLEKEKEMYQLYKGKLGDFDIIHGHTWFGCEYLFKSEDPKARICHTHHGHLHWKSKPPNVEKLNLIGISDWMKRVYESQGWSARFVYNGIEIEKYPFKMDKGEKLLFVGRFSTFKQPHVAIEVAKRLDMPIDLVGGTFVDDPNYLEGIKGMCDGDKIKMWPDAPHETKLELMQNAKCLLFPSRMGEPFGLVAAEAMTCGTPTVALNDGAIKEVVKDSVTGYVCDNTDQMVEAVKRVDEIKPEVCRKRIEENFSREVMAANYLRLYECIIKKEEW